MKHAFLFIMVFAFVLVSCKKESNSSNDFVKDSESNVEFLILNFKDRIENPFKDELILEPDSAVWYLEGLLNYMQANNSHEFSQLKFYRDSIQISFVDGGIDIHTIRAAFDFVNQKMEQELSNSDDSTTFVDIVDIELGSNIFKDGSVILKVVFSTGIETRLNYTLFTQDEDWLWGSNLGGCGTNQSIDMSDASNELEYRFNHPLSQGQTGWFYSVEEIDAMGWEEPYFDESNPGPFCDGMIFYYEPPEDDLPIPCIQDYELNYYLSKFDHIKALNKPAGKIFRSVEVIDDIIPNFTDNYYHRYKMYFGKIKAIID